MKDYMVYCATDGKGNTYYGFTTDLKKRINEHFRSFYGTKSHTSRDMLSYWAREHNIHPKDWSYTVLFHCNDKAMALKLKKDCVRNDPNSINYVYKFTSD